MYKQCATSSVQFSEVCDNSQEFCVQETQERCSLKENSSNYVCNICNKSFAREQDLDDHIKIHLNKPHVCTICSKSYNHQRTLKEHLSTHSGEKHECNICKKSFSRKEMLKRHSFTHSEKKPHICKICNKSFTAKGILKDHLLIHSGEKPYVCNICSMSFRLKSYLKKHSLIHNRKKDMQDSSIDRGEELSFTSEESKNVNSDSYLAETSENSYENNHLGKFHVKEEIDYIVKEEHDISDEEYCYQNVGEMLIKSDVDLHGLSGDVKEENIHHDMNNVVKEEHDIDYEEMVYEKCSS